MNESELLFTDILGCDRASLYLNKGRLLRVQERMRIASALKRRMRGEPIQYILKKCEFMGLEFKLTPSVLIPRPETEILVEKAHALALSLKPHVPCPHILDMGTGSGCIAVTLATLLPGAVIDAVDISNEALRVARENAAAHNARINFIQGDLFCQALIPARYDLIVSNPPYVAGQVIAQLQPELRHEPRVALDGGKDGLDFYRRLVRFAPEYLRKAGILLMEMGFGQRQAIEEMIGKAGTLAIMDIVKDYSGIERVVMAQRKMPSGA